MMQMENMNFNDLLKMRQDVDAQIKEKMFQEVEEIRERINQLSAISGENVLNMLVGTSAGGELVTRRKRATPGERKQRVSPKLERRKQVAAELKEKFGEGAIFCMKPQYLNPHKLSKNLTVSETTIAYYEMGNLVIWDEAIHGPIDEYETVNA